MTDTRTTRAADATSLVRQYICAVEVGDEHAVYENDCIGVFTIRTGKIQAVREYMDTLYAHNTAFGNTRRSASHHPI